jgi:hypothetical protein
MEKRRRKDGDKEGDKEGERREISGRYRGAEASGEKTGTRAERGDGKKKKARGNVRGKTDVFVGKSPFRLREKDAFRSAPLGAVAGRGGYC